MYLALRFGLEQVVRVYPGLLEHAAKEEGDKLLHEFLTKLSSDFRTGAESRTTIVSTADPLLEPRDLDS